MGRDLLYKPKTTAIASEDDEGSDVKKAAAKKKAASLQTKVDSVQDAAIKRVLQKAVQGASKSRDLQSAPSPTETSRPASTGKAHQAAYFTKDVDSARAANHRATGMQALRGSKEATDLRKVVIPTDMEVDVPNPSAMLAGLERMGIEDEFGPGFEDILGRLGASTQQEGMTPEKLEARMAELDAMVEARKAAVDRIRTLREADQGRPSVTVEHAMAGDGLDAEDLAGAGSQLIGRTAGQADGLHARVSKALGIKR